MGKYAIDLYQEKIFKAQSYICDISRISIFVTESQKQRHMKKLFILLAVAGLTACNEKKQTSIPADPLTPALSILGDWVQPIPGMEDKQQGISLKENGVAASINMATLQYKSWEAKDSLLLLSGTSIGNHTSSDFTDSLVIRELTDSTLILQRGELTDSYQRAK